MADFQTCYDFMESNEDAQNSHKQVPDACPPGCAGPCYAISGINSGAWPAQFAAIAALPQAARGPAVQEFYDVDFWDNWLGQLSTDAVAMRVFDFAVNSGHGTATRTIQQAVLAVDPGAGITTDGAFGPATVAAINAVDPGLLVTAFQALRRQHYLIHDAASPALPGLLARAAR